MSQPARLSLRLLGFLLLALAFLIVFLMIFPGPGQIANMMGESCSHTENGPVEQCRTLDVLSALLFVPFLFIGGLVLALVFRPQARKSCPPSPPPDRDRSQRPTTVSGSPQVP